MAKHPIAERLPMRDIFNVHKKGKTLLSNIQILVETNLQRQKWSEKGQDLDESIAALHF
jgi:hypothetical protein